MVPYNFPSTNDGEAATQSPKNRAQGCGSKNASSLDARGVLIDIRHAWLANVP